MCVDLLEHLFDSKNRLMAIPSADTLLAPFTEAMSSEFAINRRDSQYNLKRIKRRDSLRAEKMRLWKSRIGWYLR